MKQPSTLAGKGPVRAVNLKEIRVFLYFSVLTFTWRTSRHNALARGSKSLVASFRRDCRDARFCVSTETKATILARIVSQKKGALRGDRATRRDARFCVSTSRAPPLYCAGDVSGEAIRTDAQASR